MSAISLKMLHSDSWEQFKIQDIASIGRGRVISSVEISQQENPLYPVYSSQTSNDGIMGYLDDFMFEGEYISWTTDGANAGTVFYRNGQSDLYKPIRSKVDNSLRSIDLMHFVWNIGERLDISLIDRATFIHTIFPHELKDASIKYLAKNLRTCGVCKIALDIPKTGDYHFKITKFCTV